MNEHANGNTMYERCSAVSELNKVPGFDPLRFARKVVQGGAEKLMLDLKYKKLWYRLRYPQGRIKVTPLKITEQLAIIEAKIFFDRSDTVPAASFIAQRYAKDTPGGLYIESAQHMAVDTALNDAGFGVQLMSAGAETKLPAQAEVKKAAAPVEVPIAAPQTIAAAAPPIANEPVAPAQQEQRLPREALPAEELPVTPAEPMSVAEAAPAQEEARTEEPSAVVTPMREAAPPAVLDAAEKQSYIVAQAPVEQPPAVMEAAQTPPALEVSPVPAETAVEDPPVDADADTESVRYTADMSVEEICTLMTLDEAKNIIVDIGTCKGQTLEWVSERRAASLKWYLNGYEGDNNLLRAGAKLLLESLAMSKAS